jgi:flagellar biosynthesis protein FliP
MSEVLIGFGIGVAIALVFIVADLIHFERTGYFFGEKP